MKNPWMKFYPQDWRGDQTLRICSLEARGLWIEMVCIMHEADPYGHLVINGHPVTDAQLGALTGTDLSTISRLKTELETAGVYSKTGKGTIYSRRMNRDHKKMKDGEKNAKKRWKGEKTDDSQDNENIDEKSAPNGVANGSPKQNPIVRSQKLEARKKEYWWAGTVIKLLRKHYDEWGAIFPGSDDQFTDWLISRDRWLAEQAPHVRANWFISTRKAIEKLSKGETA